MKFLVDMGLSMTTVHYLRRKGHEAVHLRDEGLQRMSDPRIIDKARREKRIILTHDLDFSDLLAASRAALPSVVIFRLRDMRPANVNAHLGNVLMEAEDELEQGVVISVSEGQMRIRMLPIGDA